MRSNTIRPIVDCHRYSIQICNADIGVVLSNYVLSHQVFYKLEILRTEIYPILSPKGHATDCSACDICWICDL